MKKNFSLFLALRYLKPKRTYVSIITLISVIGVTLGVAVLIIVIAVMTGFEKKIKENILAFDPHVALMLDNFSDPSLDEDTPSRWDNVRKKYQAMENVEAVFPFVEGQILMKYHVGGTTRVAAQMMRAVYEEDDDQIALVRRMMEENTDPDLSGDSMIISRQLADEYGILIGDVIEIDSSRNMEKLITERDRIMNDPEIKDEDKNQAIIDAMDEYSIPLELTVTGFFDSLWFQNYVIVRLAIGQDLYDLGPHVHGLAVQLDDAYRAGEFNVKHLYDAPPYWSSHTWMDKYRLRFETIRNERSMMYFVLFFIVVVAAFSIMNTMITVTVQKRREIGVMKALGAREGQIVWVFLAQGMIVGIVGTALGLGLGALITIFRNDIRSWLAENVGVSIFPQQMYKLAEIPADIVGKDVAVIGVGAFILCALAALIPAYIAARLDPAKALRD